MDLIRGLHLDTLAALAAGNFHPILMVDVDWPDGHVYAHSGRGDLTWDSQTWMGVAGYGSVSIPQESADGAPSSALLTMVLAEADFDAVMAADIRGRDGILYAALTTERAGNTLIGEPFELFSGYMDGRKETYEDEDGGIAHLVHIELGSGAEMRASATVVHSHEDQQRDYPSDTIGRLLINSRDRQKRIVW